MAPTSLARPVVPLTATPRQIAARGSIRVAVIGATGYAGGELVRWLAGHPAVTIVGLVGRDRDREPIARSQPHLAGTALHVDDDLPEADAVFLALPHGQAAVIVPDLVASGRAVIDLGADFRLHDPADYPRWYHLAHPAPDLLASAVYGLPELHRAELAAAGDTVGPIVAAPGCYPTAAILALAPLARAGLLDDVVVDAKSGVSGAGREPRPEMTFAEVNESVRAYGLDGHRHTAEMEQELTAASIGAGHAALAPLTFVPHLMPMTRGILATCHVRPTHPVDQGTLDELYAEAYADEPFVSVVADAPATKHVLASNEARINVRWIPRTGRVLVIAVIDNLAKGAASQGVQAFNIVFGLDERTGLTALPVAP
ncbi:MAG: N-acetyl-gamma-glutamyl-phosphate reductase [Candidatus Limnocylindrales bacterium]